MTSNPYESPKALLSEGEANPLIMRDYHDLVPLRAGRIKIMMFLCFIVICLLLYAALLIYSIFNPGLPYFSIVRLIFLIGLFGTVAYGVFSSHVWGLYVGVVMAILCLFVFPLGTILGLIALRGFYQARSIYTDRELSFEKLKEAYRPYK